MLRKSFFMLRQSLIKDMSFYVAIEYPYVAIEFGLGCGFYVTTEYYYVATESSWT